MLIFIALVISALAALALARFLAHLGAASGHARNSRAAAPDRQLSLPRLFDEESDRKARREKRRLFRQRLDSLTEQYSVVFTGIRQAMVDSGVDRPDLAKALLKNRILFAVTLCRIDLYLAMHALGARRAIFAGSPAAIEALWQQIHRLESTVWGG